MNPHLSGKQVRQRAQLERLRLLLGFYKKDLAARLGATRKLFGRPVCLVDIHTHSLHSDGLGTVTENAERVKACGLDFFFATDHGSLRQKQAVKKLSHAGWGQEPGAGMHHIGLLANTRLFRPRLDSIGTDFYRAQKLAPFVWIPHPAGWYPVTNYTPKQIKSLWQLGPAFAMEIINGATQMINAYDKSDQQAVLAWDRLLCDGRKVTAVAGSDAHSPDDIGTTWTGVLISRRSATAIIQALNQGLCFASESTLMDFSCNNKPMGTTIRVRPKTPLTFRFRVADAGGLASIRIISQGQVIKTIVANNRKVMTGSLIQPALRQPAYFRLETTASDDRRAFSTPIYIELVR